MNENDRQIIIENIRSYQYLFDDEGLEQYLMLIETYSNNDLRRLIVDKNDVAIFLEQFFIMCLESKIYMDNLTKYDISDFENVLTGDIGSDLFNDLFGYYSWLSQMATYYLELYVNSVTREYYYSTLKLMKLSKDMRTDLFNSEIEDEVYREIIANFVDVFTSQLEEQNDLFIESCIMCANTDDIYTLNQDFINYNENKIDIYTTNTKIYDRIINRLMLRFEKIYSDSNKKIIDKLLKDAIRFQIAKENLNKNQEILRKTLSMDLYEE